MSFSPNAFSCVCQFYPPFGSTLPPLTVFSFGDQVSACAPFFYVSSSEVYRGGLTFSGELLVRDPIFLSNSSGFHGFPFNGDGVGNWSSG